MDGRLRVGLGVAAAVAALAVLWAPRSPARADAEAPRVEPARGVATTFPAAFGVRRVFVDAGHGAEDNRGAASCFCADEQDYTLAAAERVAARLAETGHFLVRLSREGDERVPYDARVRDAEAFGADAFVSLHFDVRGRSVRWSPAPGESCALAFGGDGFAVLYGDEGDAGLAAARLGLARALATRLSAAGFSPYAEGYDDLYAPDAVAGVFVDRHAPGRRIFVLRRPSMPSVILETYNALDPREVSRWSELATLDAAADALAAALVDALR
ncbi:MAG TPA: N-acetylmuramoyl-L-alanine amidase [Minicystis sp.]|nr:N-acetylmuramoyl-L-alanine amidase [Minicystis sp.]